MALADDLRPLLHSVRAIPGQLGLREHSVVLIAARTSGGDYTGDGARWEIETALTHAGGYAPKVRWPKDQDVAMGIVPDGQVTIGPITTDFPGYELIEKLTGRNLETGAQRGLRITGPKHPNGADYRITSVKLERALHLMVTAIPVGTQR